MKTLNFGSHRVILHPTVTTSGAVTVQHHAITGRPAAPLRAFFSVMQGKVTGLAAKLTKPLRTLPDK
jgi:hypothetical protein